MDVYTLVGLVLVALICLEGFLMAWYSERLFPGLTAPQAGNRIGNSEDE